ncbi:LCP family protein [Rhodococcus aerolatus]
MPRPARHRPRRGPLHRARTAVAVAAATASALVLVGTGVAWSTVRDLRDGVTTSDALSAVGTAGTTTSRDGSTNILLIGLDSRKDQQGNDLPQAVLDQLDAGSSDDGGYNTNSLILIHVPDDGSRATAFSIPRDDYVAVSGIPGYDHAKIKEAYGLKKYYTEQDLAAQGVTDPATLESRGREAGRQETLQTVQNFLGVGIDRFAEVNLVGFYDLAQALGGVQVCLNNPVKDSYSGADFPAGLQTLDAAQSLAFVRQRHGLPNGDLDRTHRQQAFLAGVTAKLSSAGTFTDPTKLAALVSAAEQDVVLSAGWDVVGYAAEATNLTSGDVEFQTLPVQSYQTIDGQDVNIVDQAALQTQVKVAFGLEPAPAPAAPAPAPTVPTSTVDVRNATGTTGLGRAVSDALVGGGFTAGTVGNGTPDATTGVRYGTGADVDAAAAASLLGAPAPTADPAVPAGHVEVTLGDGFTEPTDLAQAATTRLEQARTGSAAPAATSTTATPAPADGAPDSGAPVLAGGIPCVN